MTEVGTMKVTALTEHEDGSATCTFDLDEKTAELAQELGLKLLIYCGATGTNLDYVFRDILGEMEKNDE
tara:strand:- start:1178 stop:1384 length:207 start_codon:yes stop_codon:yes gene_type:complete